MIAGPLVPNYWIVVVGRLIFGIGSETMILMQSIFVYDWFFGKELQFATGVAGSIPNLFAFLAGYFAPFCYKK